MIIRGQTVVLRAIEPDDCDILWSLINDSWAEPLLGGWSFPVSRQQQANWINDLPDDTSILRTMITVDDEAIGTAILSDIDYKNGSAQLHIKLLDGDGRRKGYGYDTVRTLVGYGFSELRLHCIYAYINECNTASINLFEKCGFQKDGVLRERLYKRGEYANIVAYSIIAAG